MTRAALLKMAFFAFSYEVALYVEGRQGFYIAPSADGLLRQRMVLDLCKRVREHCFPFWVDWMTRKTMVSVDAQAAALRDQWDQDDPFPKPLFTEVTEGDTPPGGEMRKHNEWDNDQAS